MFRALGQFFTRGGGSLGSRGETHAARYLRARDYHIVERNYTVGKDEADIIAMSPDRSTVVVVEVKTRRDEQRATPEDHINRAKQHHLSRLAAQLMKQKRFAGKSIRFDVIAIVWPAGQNQPVTIRHHEAAFCATF